MKRIKFYDKSIGFIKCFLLVALAIWILPDTLVFAQDPDCTGVNRWPTMIALVHLRNAGITDSRPPDFTDIKTVRLASEKIDLDLYRQIHHITFIERSGRKIEVISNSDVSSEECSMSGGDIYVIRQHLKDPSQ